MPSHRVACVLRSGGEYRPAQVMRLREQVGDSVPFVCLSDVRTPGVETIPLRHRWPGWWSKMELFAPWIEGDLYYLDLDTTVFRLPPAPGRTTVLRDFMAPERIGSGLMYLRHEDRAQVWRAFAASPERNMRECRTVSRWGDQGFLEQFFARAQRWQDVERGIYSYKVHCRRGVPADAQVVCFHGRPRPWDIPELSRPAEVAV